MSLCERDRDMHKREREREIDVWRGSKKQRAGEMMGQTEIQREIERKIYG